VKASPGAVVNPIVPGKKKQLFPVWIVVLLMLPGLLHYCIFRLYPSIMTAVYSFTDISGLPGKEWKFIGWNNYKEFFVLQNPRDLRAALSRTIIYSVSVTLIQNFIALVMAVILNKKFLKGRNFARSIFFMPVILGAAVVSTMWKLTFSTPTGPVFLFMKDVLHMANPPAILASRQYAFPAVIAAQIWQNMGYSMVIFLAALQSIPEDLNEAALIDGAGELQVFWRITVPMIWSAVTVNTLLAIIGSLQSYELIMTITRGQFNTATLGMMVFATAFGGNGASASGGSVSGMRQGYAAAESMVLFVAVLVVTIISRAIMNKMEAEK
jgi:raffinose/stachyose/melibiose transport system permease protein